MIQTASNWNIESPLARSKLLTNWFNNDLNNTLRDFFENQITSEDRITVARAKPFFLPIPMAQSFKQISLLISENTSSECQSEFVGLQPAAAVDRSQFILVTAPGTVNLKLFTDSDHSIVAGSLKKLAQIKTFNFPFHVFPGCSDVGW